MVDTELGRIGMLACGEIPVPESARVLMLRGAELLGLADRIGAVKPGYYADLLIVRGDPVSHITAIRSVSVVIKSGQVVFAERRLSTEGPEDG